VYEIPINRPFPELDDDDFDDEDVQAYGRENVGPIASPYIILEKLAIRL